MIDKIESIRRISLHRHARGSSNSVILRSATGLAILLLAACGGNDPFADAPVVYTSSCLPCHGDGLGGAPITGDADEWERRIAKGMSKVQRNAIDGFEGGTGVMPPKGGRPDLPDAEINTIVDWMIEVSQ